MAVNIAIPDFNFSGFYYAEILEDLIQYLRTNVPELTDESPEEPYIQLTRAVALAAHLNNVLLDMVAKERFLPTAALRASVAAHLKLIDYPLHQASPAVSDFLLALSKTFSTVTNIIPAPASFSTLGSDTAPAINFEALTALTLTKRTDQVGSVFGYAAGAAAFTDYTAAAIAATSLTPAWGTTLNDALYIGHPDVMFANVMLNVSVANVDFQRGLWEYYDNNYDYVAPVSVVNNGTNLTFNVNSFFGSTNCAGAQVRVKCVITGAYEDLTVSFVSGNNVVTTSAFLGQASPSAFANDYITGWNWKPLKSVVDPTSGLSVTGTNNLTFQLPQTLTEKWAQTTVNGVSGYFIRFRNFGGANAGHAPTIVQIRIDQGTQYVLTTVTQGISRQDSPLGSSTGLANQAFQLANFPVIDDSSLIVYVTEATEAAWTHVQDFLSSTAVDTHFRVEYDDTGSATVIFGDGINGKIPAAGTGNIRAVYRTMADANGNVGQNSITVNSGGVSYVNSVLNPRPASGYKVRDGSTDADISRLKIAGPASLRTKGRAVTPQDFQDLAKGFVAADGSQPVSRAFGIEESFGPKTMEVVCVGQGGSAIPAPMLSQLNDYFNGNDALGIRGVGLMNGETTCTNFVPHTINVVATVYGGNQSAITTALTALLNPNSVQSDDGVTFNWNFSGTVPLNRLVSEIMTTEPRPRDCSISSPASNTTLALRELPVVGTLTITVVP